MSASAAAATLMRPVGPVAEAFVNDWRLITGIMGPVGSAKTTTCIRKCLMAALKQPKGPDGVRRARGAVVRDTYPQLKKTVLASWWTWFPKSMGDWNGEAPYTHRIYFEAMIGGRHERVELEMIFAAIGEQKAEDVMRGWELTFLWLNEGDLVSHEVLLYGMGRVGRYPSEKDGGCGWRGIFIDMNAPEIDNWTYKVLVEKDLGLDDAMTTLLKAELGELFGVGFHLQPGGRSINPPPENLANLPPGYYAQQIMAYANRPDLLRRMVDNLFGPLRSGTPVYPEFRDAFHCRAFEPVRGLPLLIFADQGLLGAALIAQLVPNLDQLRVLDELCRVFEGEDGHIEVSQIGGEAFGREVAAHCAIRFPGFEIADALCDPAGAAGEEAINHRSWRQEFQKGLRVPVRKARVPGNAIEPRLQAVRKRLNTTIHGEPRLLIHERCKVLRKGFNSAYAWRRVQVGKTEGGRFDSKPLKIQGISDVQDALQYGAFECERGLEYGFGGRAGGKRRVIQNEMH